MQSVPAGQRPHLRTRGLSPPPPARRRRFLPSGIRESRAPQAPASRAAWGWSKGGEFGKLVNTQAPPPLSASPAVAPSRRPQPAQLETKARRRPRGLRPEKLQRRARLYRGTPTPGAPAALSSPAASFSRSWVPIPWPARSRAKCGRAPCPGVCPGLAAPVATCDAAPRGCRLRTWLSLTSHTTQVPAGYWNCAAPSAGGPRQGCGEDLPPTALLAPVFPVRALGLRASRGALQRAKSGCGVGRGEVCKKPAWIVASEYHTPGLFYSLKK